MKAITRNIPNAVTSLNLLSGCLAISFAFSGMFEVAAYCIFAAAFFDLCDGLVARALKVSSPLGVQLDSLADVVSFGVAPACLMHIVLSNILEDRGMGSTATLIWSFIPFIVAVFSAIRLAKFNIDTRQTESFLGLPTPANGLLITSAMVSATLDPDKYAFILNPWTITIAAIVLSGLLVSEIPMFSLKFKKQESVSAFLSKYSVQLIFIVLCAISPFFYGLFCIAAMMLLYIILSVYRWLVGR